MHILFASQRLNVVGSQIYNNAN